MAAPTEIAGKSLLYIEERMNQLLRTNNLSLTKVLNDTKIYRSGWNNMLAKRNCTMAKIEKLSDYFNLPIQYFLYDPRQGSVEATVGLVKEVERLREENEQLKMLVKSQQLNIELIKKGAEG